MIGSIVSAIIIGAVIGALARLILPGRQNLSIGLTLIVGIIAALIGTAIAASVGLTNTRGINWWEHLIQLALAVIGVLLVVQMQARKSH
ncbi:GlsB/YeaQ/YmgE family stress response membrane protein [Streptosporangium sp. NBC_01755]|uniref:GlsB/YeaQ/YmgE family stress response membrane protein n=1 Tax=unclassified Streptosporangium TaxID=2632669 RepID=UPI002DD9E63A|nr:MULTISPECIES: GlsB/YeaQ/YmgE family stress response membrane protein [unclassified Streptosporangium]WSA24528.1 GlsB/YeaQ/YmgE family stress response membrane protein [Streptosporangium sp. NBC_01810]WSC97398.1 GlsB/YeaQ/YmgE family stress response membrane protein [Streptosporangium sp. NBC_01755]